MSDTDSIRDVLEGLMRRHDRVALTGGPMTGKTTLADSLAPMDERRFFHTDATMHLQWEEQPIHWLNTLRDIDDFLVEGVQVPRILRKGLSVDAVLMLTQPHGNLTQGQRSMTRAIETVMQDVLSGPSSFEFVIC